MWSSTILVLHIEEKNPLKQGLKPIFDIAKNFGIEIEEKNPLKQGLKHKYSENKPYNIKIEEKNPLKQGLKQPAKTIKEAQSWDWREESIKTRIETGKEI